MSDEFEKEVMWTVSGTGEDFQCVHIDYAREQQAKIEKLQAALELLCKLDSKLGIAIMTRVGLLSTVCLDDA